MSDEKHDAARIRRHLQALRQAAWLGEARRWWPSYLFHFTDVLNAVNILEGGKLVCRSQAKMAKDIASAQVINQTDAAWKDYVRLYFRPRTPTQFHNEGFRPCQQPGALHAHCPMPIFLLFDAAALLTREATRFSDGNLAAANPRIGDDAVFFESIPFEMVYHNSRVDESNKRSIVYHRHAEVLVPNELDLHGLRWVACRTEAEMRTLRQLLSRRTWQRFLGRVKVVRPLFFRQRTFVEDAELDQNKVTIRFNRSSTVPGPFRVQLTIVDFTADKRYYWRDDPYSARDTLQVAVPQLGPATPYEARLTLDDSIAYADTFLPEEEVF